MSYFRRRKFELGWLTSLIMLLGMMATTVAPHPAQAGGKQIYDAVLGWMPVCAPSEAGKSDQSRPQHSQSGHACCAFACAAAATATAIPDFSSTAVVHASVSEPFTAAAISRPTPSNLVPGRPGSRGPPLSI